MTLHSRFSSPLLAACGLYCGACNHYRATFPEGKHLLELAAYQGHSMDGFTCLGCRSKRLYIHPGCAHCQIRACAEVGGLLHCGQCREFPCEWLLAFRNDGHRHHLNILTQIEQLNLLGPERWPAEQAHRWTCQCGATFSWYEERCQNCGVNVNSYVSGNSGST